MAVVILLGSSGPSSMKLSSNGDDVHVEGVRGEFGVE